MLDEFGADPTSLPTCPWRVGRYASSSWRAVFRCGAGLCGRRIVAERFEDGVLAPWARRMGRLDYVIHHLGIALRRSPAASFARSPMLPVSNNTLPRVVRRGGSVFCAAQGRWDRRLGLAAKPSLRNRPFATWNDVKRSPCCRIANRPRRRLALWPTTDFRGRLRPWRPYALATAKALPNAIQVANRWHLMQNASRLS
jgi:hypothetical protein